MYKIILGFNNKGSHLLDTVDKFVTKDGISTFVSLTVARS